MAKATKPPAQVVYDDKTAEEILRVWRTMNDYVMDASEENLWGLYRYELEHKARRLFLQRLYGRASKLRAQREAKELRESARDIS